MYAAGGGTDTVIRAISNEMARIKGWQINAINKPGAVGGIATNFMLGKPSDGYWWLGAANYNKFVRVVGEADTIAWKDWQYFQAANAIGSWSVRPDSPYQSFEDIAAAAKERPGQLTISTSGTGGLWHEMGAIIADAAGIELKFVPYKGGRPATLAGLQGEVDITGGGVHEHIDFIRAGELRNIVQTGTGDIEVEGHGALRTVSDVLPSLKPLLPLSGIYNIAMKRDTSTEVLNEVKDAFVAAVESEAFGEIARQKYFQVDIRWGEEADRRAALVETVTAATFEKLQDQIGKKVRGPAELGLPRPEEFDSWWPPAGYEPRMA
jgi:tripartite-type tricarboxylate transporter receptor subunit TctC